LLQIIWDECSFDEIIDAGLDLNKCSSSDIINAASEYEDPEKSALEDIIAESSIEDVMEAVRSEFTIEDIVGELDRDDILDCFDKDDILWYLEGSYDLENHDDAVKEEYYHTMYEEIVEEIESAYNFNYKQFIKDITEEYSPDDYHELICDILGVGYYDKDRFKEKIKMFINKLNKNNYGIKYDKD
jgi:hypothetical protein